MRVRLNLHLRDWDYLTPLALGDVVSDSLEIKLSRSAVLPSSLAPDSEFDASEISFSRFVRSVSEGRDDVFGVPNFLMRGFRHRCAITREESKIRRFSDLKGCRIGLTGWPDSGNTWTRHAISRAGVEILDAHWFTGRLTAGHPNFDRLEGYGQPGKIEAIPENRSLTEMLDAGGLDTVLTPFMPRSFFYPTSHYRFLADDIRKCEIDYFNDQGFVPGHHILGIKRHIVEQYPWLPKELSDLLDRSRQLWQQKRQKYAETTAWIIEDLYFSARTLPKNWDATGLEENRGMIRAFLSALDAQGICKSSLSPDDLFPTVDAFFATKTGIQTNRPTSA